MSDVLTRAKQRAFDRLYPTPDPYANDPTGWITYKLKAWLWSKQREICESVRDHRFTAVPSCHGPGKTFVASAIAAWWIDVHPPGEAFVVTTAPTDSQVKSILWREIRRRHREANMSGRITLEAHWYLGDNPKEDELVGIGRKPQDYDPGAFQGIHAKYVLVIVDEAGGVPKQLTDSLETLMTNDYARFLAIGNPDDPAMHFENMCRPGSGYNVIRIPAYSTPNFTGEFVPQHVAEQLVTKLWVHERVKKWGRTSPMFQSKVMALFPEIGDDTLITPSMVRRAQNDIWLPGTQLGSYGLDVARFGVDETVCYRHRGGRVRLEWRHHKEPTNVTKDKALMTLAKHGANYVPMVVDVIGVGGGVVDEMRAADANVVPFHGQEAANDPIRFANRKTECFWEYREMFERDEVDLDPDDEDLAAQLTSIKWKIIKKGQIVIESKADMKKRGLASPDRADGSMMATTVLRNYDEGPMVIPLPTVTAGLMEEEM